MVHVSIEPITIDDTSDIIRWRNNPKVLRWFINQEKIDEEKHQKWFTDMIETKIAYQFIIKNIEEGKNVGSVFIRDIDRQNGKAEFGIFIGEDDQRGKGIAQHAIRLILEFSFNNLKLNKIFLRVLSNNEDALKSYEKAGFFKDGLAREDVKINGIYRDVIFMSILKEEYYK